MQHLQLYLMPYARLQHANRNHGAANGKRIFKLQILRAVACNIVKHRDFYPTKEVLLKHSMSYLGMFDEFKGASACAASICM